MAAAIATTTRLEIAEILRAATHREVITPAPPVPIPPCLVVTPDAAWITPSQLGSVKRYELGLKVMCVARDNQEGLTEVEAAVQDVMEALAAVCAITEATAPAVLDTGAQGTVLVSEVKLSIHVKE